MLKKARGSVGYVELRGSLTVWVRTHACEYFCALRYIVTSVAVVVNHIPLSPPPCLWGGRRRITADTYDLLDTNNSQLFLLNLDHPFFTNSPSFTFSLDFCTVWKFSHNLLALMLLQTWFSFERRNCAKCPGWFFPTMKTWKS